ncbi:uncharacterized protein A4U43_C04F23730 [Asparagus officinalis]|uniref:Uncharacterized protein n=1 Tax=Asparagus officinalis TaxID=4686 RepID=A0A5P1F374_ASPOF|nr:uncharacterized protein A4U43_C04F23730 [Asparagus officinalis]
MRDESFQQTSDGAEDSVEAQAADRRSISSRGRLDARVKVACDEVVRTEKGSGVPSGLGRKEHRMAAGREERWSCQWLETEIGVGEEDEGFDGRGVGQSAKGGPALSGFSSGRGQRGNAEDGVWRAGCSSAVWCAVARADAGGVSWQASGTA